jgi:hypothetical protein
MADEKIPHKEQKDWVKEGGSYVPKSTKGQLQLLGLFVLAWIVCIAIAILSILNR